VSEFYGNISNFTSFALCDFVISFFFPGLDGQPIPTTPSTKKVGVLEKKRGIVISEEAYEISEVSDPLK